MRTRSLLVLGLFLSFLAITLHGQTVSADSSLVLSLPFDGNADDMSGHGNNGTVQGPTLTADRFGAPNSAYLFRAPGDKITIANSPSINPTDQLTLTFWVRVDSMVNNYLAVLSKAGPMTANQSNREYAVYLRTSSASFSFFELKSAGDEAGQHEGRSNELSYHAWHFFAGVIDRKNHLMQVYLDSLKQFEASDSYSTFNVNSAPLYLGWESEQWPDHSGLNGALDDVRLYTRALSQAEIRDLYSADTTGSVGLPSELRFGVVPVGSLSGRTLLIVNRGGAVLSVAGLASNSPVFMAPQDGFPIAPHSAKSVVITYAPTAARLDTGVLSVTSNDPKNPELKVRLSGRGYLPVEAPVIAGITDIPDDNGRQVRVSWYRSVYDTLSAPVRVSSYSLYRKVEGQDDLWDFVASVPAERFREYSYVAPTLRDVNPVTGVAWSVFRVSAHLFDERSYLSDADSGYSVDSYPPAQPTGLAGQMALRGVTLIWTPARETDLDHYLVFRSTTQGFDLSSGTLIGRTDRGYSYTDTSAGGGRTYYYRIVAVDEAGNWSKPSVDFALFVTGVAASRELPRSLSLEQNFPNPFNPATTISFALPAKSRVRLEVYNPLGQKMMELVNGELEAGYHQASFRPGPLATGVYFYRLTAGGFVSTKKCVYVR